MDLMTIILSCSLHTLNDQLLHSIAMAQSNGNTLQLRSSHAAQAVDFRDTSQAQKALARMLQTGDDVYIGVMGVPLSAAKKYDVDPAALLDTCTNVRVASAILSAFESQCEEQRQETFGCTVNKYAVLTERNPAIFLEEVLYGAVSSPDANGAFPTNDEKIEDAVFWESNSTGRSKNALFFDVDVGNTRPDTAVRIAADIDEAPRPPHDKKDHSRSSYRAFSDD